MANILGIDEAGRGPIIGPMVMAGAMMEEKELYHLDALRVMDSKLLTAKRREILAEKIMQISKYKNIIILPF